MMASWLVLLISILAALAFLGGAAGLIYLGYWMGRNSLELPVRSASNPRELDQGSTDDPGGDPFEEAMALPEGLDDDDDRISTL